MKLYWNSLGGIVVIDFRYDAIFDLRRDKDRTGQIKSLKALLRDRA